MASPYDRHPCFGDSVRRSGEGRSAMADRAGGIRRYMGVHGAVRAARTSPVPAQRRLRLV